MPYEYRKLSPQEKEEIVHIRKARGYPLHSPPHPIRTQGVYLITAACFEHAAVMDTPARRTEFEIRLLSDLQKVQAEALAWAVLPNHYHFLADFPDFECIPGMLKRLHNGTAYEWNRADGCTGKRRVWYHYADHFMRTENQMLRSFNYIHFNPVKHGYVDSPYDWEWSSLGLYAQDQGRDWLRDRWVKYPPAGMEFD